VGEHLHAGVDVLLRFARVLIAAEGGPVPGSDLRRADCPAIRADTDAERALFVEPTGDAVRRQAMTSAALADPSTDMLRLVPVETESCAEIGRTGHAVTRERVPPDADE
jgi:hypothetical protein